VATLPFTARIGIMSREASFVKRISSLVVRVIATSVNGVNSVERLSRKTPHATTRATL
jgi:hypothetical protein